MIFPLTSILPVVQPESGVPNSCSICVSVDFILNVSMSISCIIPNSFIRVKSNANSKREIYPDYALIGGVMMLIYGNRAPVIDPLTCRFFPCTEANYPHDIKNQ